MRSYGCAMSCNSRVSTAPRFIAGYVGGSFRERMHRAASRRGGCVPRSSNGCLVHHGRLSPMRLFDNRYESHQRKYTLALWMIERGARIRTVTRWTGLSKYCVQNLTRSYGSKTRIPCNRGRSPSKPAYFLKSPDVARESVALAYISLQCKAIPAAMVPDARTSLPGIERGERVMDAFEVYRALVPNARISLEHAILLIIELAERSALMLVRCRNCHDVMVV